MKNTNRLCMLPMFREVAEETMDQMWGLGKVVDYKKGTLLTRAKETIDHVYIQLTGKSVVYNLTHDGKRKIIFIFGPGVLLNEHIENFHEASMYCEILEKSEVFEIPSKLFLACMKMDFDLTRAVLTAQEKKIWRLGHQLKNTMGSIYMERKLAAKLWKLARDFGICKPDGIEIDINMTITFLADMLGAPRETTSRICKTLTDYGLMRLEKKRITIINPQKMSQFYKTGKI